MLMPAGIVQCSPACRLTPAASYMTIKLKARLTANKELPRPNSSAVAAVTACFSCHSQSCCHVRGRSKNRCIVEAGSAELRTEHRAEWEDGMPPESTIAFRSHTPLRHLLVKICSFTHCRCTKAHIQQQQQQLGLCCLYLAALRKKPAPEAGHKYIVLS